MEQIIIELSLVPCLLDTVDGATHPDSYVGFRSLVVWRHIECLSVTMSTSGACGFRRLRGRHEEVIIVA